MEEGDANAGLLQKGDPHRFRAAMTAPAPVRGPLMALYAFNLEVARAPWVSREPLLGQMRLAWWSDQIAAAAKGGRPDPHPVLDVLAPILARGGALPDLLAGMIAARQLDFEPAPFADSDALFSYLSDTSGALFAASVNLLTDVPAPAGARAIGTAQGLAAWFAALPELTARGRQPLPDPTPQAVAALARRGLDLLGAGRLPAPARPALIAASEARPILIRAVRRPENVLDGRLARPEIRIRARQMLCAFTGRI